MTRDFYNSLVGVFLCIFSLSLSFSHFLSLSPHPHLVLVLVLTLSDTTGITGLGQMCYVLKISVFHFSIVSDPSTPDLAEFRI